MKITPEQAQEVISFLNLKDLGDEFDMKKFKETFSDKFDQKTALEEERAKIGQRIGSASREVIRIMKDSGVNFEDGELKGEDGKELKIEEIVKLGSSKLKTSLEDQIKELKDSAGKTDDKKLKELEGKLAKANEQWEQDKGMLGKLKEELNKEKEDKEKTIRSFLVNDKFKENKQKLKLVSDLPQATIKGFEVTLKEQYDFDIDEESNFIVKTKDGKRVENPEKVGEYLTPADVMERVADENNMLVKNNGGNQTSEPAKTEPETEPVKGRMVHPSLR